MKNHGDMQTSKSLCKATENAPYYGIEYYTPVKRAIRRLTGLKPAEEVPDNPGVLYENILDGLAIDVFVKTTELKKRGNFRDPRGLLFKVLVKVVIDYLQKVGDKQTLMKIKHCSSSVFDPF
jgi:hypothetical protein